MKSVKDVTEIVDLSRRKIQEYEKAGVTAKPVHKTERGYLRYDGQDIGRLMQVRFYRGLGYSQSEIRKILSDTHADRRFAVTAKLPELTRRKAELESLITIAAAMQDTQIPDGILTGSVPGLEDLPYPLLIASFSAGIEEARSGGLELRIQELSQQELTQCLQTLEEFLEQIRSGCSPEAPGAQQQLAALHRQLAGIFSPSILVLSIFSQLFMPGTELHGEMDTIWGPGSGDALYQGMIHYCKANRNSPPDELLSLSIRRIDALARKGNPPDAGAVQAQVAALHRFLREIRIFYPPIQVLADIGHMFARDAVLQYIDSGQSYQPAKYLSQAIEIYCNRHKEEEESI